MIAHASVQTSFEADAFLLAFNEWTTPAANGRQRKPEKSVAGLALRYGGMTDVEVIAVEGVAFGPEPTQKAVTAALEKVSTITARADSAIFRER